MVYIKDLQQPKYDFLSPSPLSQNIPTTTTTEKWAYLAMAWLY